ncbi:uncharacterized protein LOC132400489 isoform X1 [Hypanus sabinus]|uniref:uncharacterized protein LOC132400489 isoform X1 n=1 Tax=Hypanus sabinus TaxID=79690 RepID=UPI0028C3B78D|nr:uncharacterized protein LOC132400489 isoform X1 [Hypanus sabinus]
MILTTHNHPPYPCKAARHHNNHSSRANIPATVGLSFQSHWDPITVHDLQLQLKLWFSSKLSDSTCSMAFRYLQVRPRRHMPLGCGPVNNLVPRQCHQSNMETACGPRTFSLSLFDGSFEDPGLELHADFGTLWKWDPLSGPHDRPLFDMPRTRPGRLAIFRVTDFHGSGDGLIQGRCCRLMCHGSRQKVESSELSAGSIPRDLSSSGPQLGKSNTTDF